MILRLNWRAIVNDDDERWFYARAIYAYLAPNAPEILYRLWSLGEMCSVN